MYTFNYPARFDSPYKTLIPTRMYKYAINLCVANSAAIFQNWSIQAVSSATTSVSVWMSNFIGFPFTERTEFGEWIPPAPAAEVGGLWIPCPSIPKFTVNPQVNYFAQGEFLDAPKFLLFAITAEYPDGTFKLKDASDTPVDRVAFSMAITFK